MFRVVLTEQTISFEYNSSYGAYISNSNPSLFLPIAGEEYSIGWDGTDYTCVAFTHESAPDQVLLGNTYALGGEDTGVPFFMSSLASGSGMTVFALSTEETHSIHAYQKVTSNSSSTITIIPETTIPGFVENNGVYMNMLEMYIDTIKPGSTYTVSWDGTMYTCVAALVEDIVVVGNQAFDGGVDTGEPFVVILASPEIAGNTTGTTIIGTSDEGSSHGIAVYKLIPEGCLLDEQTVPSGQNTHIISQHLFVLEVSKTYRVLFDDEEYLVLAKEVTSNGITTCALGNHILFDASLEDTGEPFLLFSIEPGNMTGETGVTFIVTSDATESHTASVYVYEEPVNGASITLFDDKGISQAYEGVDKISLLTPEGDRQVYTCGQLPPVIPELDVDFTKGNQKISAGEGYLVREAILKKPVTLVPENILKDIDIAGIIGKFEVVDNVEVPLSMADGNQEAVSCGALQAVKRVVVIKPETLIPENIAKGIDIGGVVGSFAGGKGEHKDIVPNFADGDYTVIPEEDGVMFDSVTVKKPASLLPSNIVSGVDIAGVIGAYEAPKLYAPNNVTGPTLDSTKNRYYYAVANPTSNNGAFADTVLVVNSDETIFASVPCTGATTKVYAEDFIMRDSWTLTNFYAKLAGAGFSPSDMWDTNANIYGIFVVEYVLHNVTLNSQPTLFFQNDQLKVIATAEDNYYLPKTVSRIGAFKDFTYDPDTGVITANGFNLSMDISKYTITIDAVDIPWLRDPIIREIVNSSDMRVWYDGNTEYLVLYVDGEIASQEVPVPYVSTPQITIIDKPDGATYGFSLDSDGYYVSTNKGVSSSYSICRVDVITDAPTTLTIDCRSYGESNYDYGLISKVDSTFNFSSAADSTYFKSFKGAASANVVSVTYDVPAGEHFFYIKFIKDGSGNSYDDNFKFKISNATASVATVHTFDMSSLLTNYVTLEASVKAIANGYTDSDIVSTIIDYMPSITIEGKLLTISNLLDFVTYVDVYANGEVITTVAKGEESTLLVDLKDILTDYATTYNLYIVAAGDGVAENKSNEVSIYPEIYGVSDLYSSSASLTRTDDAIGKTYTKNTDGTVSSDFDNLFPWCAMEVVEDSLGNKFVQVPRMYFRVNADTSHVITDIAVSAAPREGEDNWYEVEPFCVGCYMAYKNGSVLQSISGVAPTGSYTRAGFRGYAKSTGTNYHSYDLYHDTILKFLWWIEFGTKNSALVFNGTYSGSGTTGGSVKVNTGGTDSLTTPTGYETTRSQMRYRYIEDFVGNMSVWLDGVYSDYQNTVCRATDNPSSFSDSTAGMYTLCYNNPSIYSNACIAGYGWDPAHPFLCMPTKTVNNSSYNTYFNDGYYNISYSSRPVVFNRTHYYGSTLSSGAGLCSLNRMASNYTAAYIGTRLIYRGTLKES